jgi:PPOX class probable F420-dependent enzyme
MTDFPASHADLLEGQVATLATIGADGLPQLTEVWFVYDEGELRFSLNRTRIKTKNLLARPECGVVLLDLSNPYRYLSVRGHASVEPDDDYSFADRVGAKYGADLRANDNPGETRVVVTVVPAGVYAVDMSG